MIGIRDWRADLDPSAESSPTGWVPDVGTEDAFNGTNGNDTLNGTANADTFNVSQGGNDTVNGLGGDDTFFFGRTLTSADRIDGGTGNDTVEIQGDATQPAGYTVIFNASSLVGVEKLLLDSGSGFSHYTIALHNTNIVAGATLTVEVNSAALTQDIFLDADFETDGHVNFTGGAGDDSMIIGGNLLATDKLNGGDGQNFLTIHGDYSDGLVFNTTTVLNFFEIDFGPGHSYEITLNDVNCAAGQTLHLDASQLSSSQSLTLNAAAETDGRLFVVGGAGNDTITMGSPEGQLPQIDLSEGGNDTATGGTGTDLFLMGGALNALDTINGGTADGFDDTVDLNGDYSAGVVFNATTMVNIEKIQLHALNSYKLQLSDATVAAGATLEIDGSSLSGSFQLTVTAASETNGSFHITGGAGNDVIFTGAGADEISLFQGGDDTATGGSGNDLFDLGAALTAADKIDGRVGDDVLTLEGDYSAGVTFLATTILSIETLALAGGFSYSLTANDGNVAAGKMTIVDGSDLAVGETLTFNGAAELDGAFTLKGGAGNDALTAGGGADTIVAGGGNDTVAGGGGGDIFVFDENLTVDDIIHGDAGGDTLVLNGDYTLAFTAAMMDGVEKIELKTAHAYTLTFADATVAAGARLTVDGRLVDNTHAVVLDGSAELDGRFTFRGGAGDDALTGGALADELEGGAGNDVLDGGTGGSDTFTGGAGADTIVVGAGPDVCVYSVAGELTGPDYDTLVGFDFNFDRIDLSLAVTGIDAKVADGKLTVAKFNKNMQRLLQADDLAANHAVLVTADEGDLAGEVFLVVDMNGVAGYQNNEDLILHLDSPIHMSNLDESIFI